MRRDGRSFMVSLGAGALALLVITAFFGLARASTYGRVGFSGNPATNGGQDCTACHGSGAALPVVTLTGPTTLVAGAVGLYTFTIAGGPGLTAGLDVSVSGGAGSLAPSGVDTQIISGELTHFAPKPFAGGQASFSFTWTAPAYGGVFTLYAAGNSTDGGFSLAGDGIKTTTLAVTVTGGGPTPIPTPTPAGPAMALTTVATGLTSPVDVTHAGDGRVFVVEKPGRIRILTNGALLLTSFLDIVARVNSSGSEMGLLGLAFHPNYAANGYFYVNYTFGNPLRTRVSRFTVTGNADLANPDSEQTILEFSQPFTNHNGGALHFGPDGYLYIASGDGGSGGDPNNSGQNKGVLLGKLLRIDVNGTGATGSCDVSTTSPKRYAIPPGNPFADGPGGNCDEIWAMGLRNPWRFSFDRGTGDLWIGDVGQSNREEIDYAAAGSAGGTNYGWRCYEGSAAYNTTGCASAAAYTLPVFDYPHTNGNCSITGGYVYRGPGLNELTGQYLFTDYCTGSLWTLNGSSVTPTLTTWTLASGSSLGTPSTFGEDLAGEIYVGSNGGQVYRITDPAPAPVAPGLGAAPNGNSDLALSWTPAAADCAYQVHQSAAPYFAPTATTRLTTLGAGFGYYNASNVLGSPTVHHFYLVRGINCSALRGANSGRVGEFEFTLAPGETPATQWGTLVGGLTAPLAPRLP